MITEYQYDLLELLKASLFCSEVNISPEADWSGIIKEAVSQTVAAIIIPSIPEEQRHKMNDIEIRELTNFARIIHAQTKLCQMFEEHEIPFVFLKGTSAAWYYPVPRRRTMGDVDLLVLPDRFEESCELLEKNGFKSIHEKDDGRHLAFHKDGVIFELHYRFSNFDHDIESIITRGFFYPVTRVISGYSFPSLPDPYNGIVFLSHIRQHLLAGGLGLRQIIDWMMFVHSYLTPVNWEQEFRALADESGFTELAKILTMMCKLYLGLPDDVSWCEDVDQVVSEELMKFIMNSGNFGRKEQKSEEQWQIEAVSRNIRRKGLLRYLQNTGELRWKALERYSYLRPFAWMYQAGRILGNGIKSGIKIKEIRKNLADGDEKGKLLKKLGLN